MSLEKRIKRLEKTQDNKYHKLLIKNPQLIILRENEYLSIFNNFKGNKIKINTGGYGAEKCA